jgi:hypothetical protein
MLQPRKPANKGEYNIGRFVFVLVIVCALPACGSLFMGPGWHVSEQTTNPMVPGTMKTLDIGYNTNLSIDNRSDRQVKVALRCPWMSSTYKTGQWLVGPRAVSNIGQVEPQNNCKYLVYCDEGQIHESPINLSAGMEVTIEVNYVEEAK